MIFFISPLSLSSPLLFSFRDLPWQRQSIVICGVVRARVFRVFLSLSLSLSFSVSLSPCLFAPLFSLLFLLQLQPGLHFKMCSTCDTINTTNLCSTNFPRPCFCSQANFPPDHFFFTVASEVMARALFSRVLKYLCQTWCFLSHVKPWLHHHHHLHLLSTPCFHHHSIPGHEADAHGHLQL